MNKHETQRVTGDGGLAGIIDVMETSPLLNVEYQGPHPPVSYNVRSFKVKFSVTVLNMVLFYNHLDRFTFTFYCICVMHSNVCVSENI